MHPRYQDILDAASIPPLWWSTDGVPRFAAFHPNMLGVYDELAVLFQVRCGDPHCRAKLRVAQGLPRIDITTTALQTNTLSSLVAGFSYGDAPRHKCPGWGETSPVDEEMVLEAWERHEGEWVRRLDTMSALERADPSPK